MTHLWLGIKPDAALAAKVKVRRGTLVVHGHGADGVALADPVQLSAAISAANATQVLLLVCKQADARRFATDHNIATWVTPDALFVNTQDGSVFIGHGKVSPTGRLTITDTKLGT